MDTAEALELNAHRLGSFAKEILKDPDLVFLLQNPHTYAIVLIPSELGIQALDEATMHQHTHNPRDYVVIAKESFHPFGKTATTVSDRQLTFKRQDYQHWCNSVQVMNDTVEGPIEAINGKIYVLDRPLQFYD